ncbi:cation:dicarboxylase symporter family transporter [Streptomyces sp. NBC_00287]|uniref:cation:dicarboxylate symporter family transporter n=1 Tax=Streptomyces sp. NBC_00287 TaxID=2975702 RepID=UPI002E289FC7|nr:cation:dicarboxylase symporter family transporter [Streptomyces sp. NBC_00287]
MTQTPDNERAAQATRIAAKPWYRQLYVQVLVAIVIGIVLGWRWPELAAAMEPLGTTFITAMKMLIGPIVFLTIVGGIAGVADLKKVGLTGIKALAYFQVGTIVAMADRFRGRRSLSSFGATGDPPAGRVPAPPGGEGLRDVRDAMGACAPHGPGRRARRR